MGTYGSEDQDLIDEFKGESIALGHRAFPPAIGPLDLLDP